MATVRLPEHRRTLGPMRSLVVGWGLFTVALYLASYILPRDFEGMLRVAYLLSGISWSLFAYTLSRDALRICAPIVAVFVLQMWSVFTTLHAWIVLGRPAMVQRPELYLIEAVAPFFVTAALVYIEPKSRNWVLWMVVAAFSLSCLVGFLQFARIGPAIALSKLYTYKSIDFWDNTPGIRAVGLTWHPRALAFQALVCMGIFAGRILAARSKKWEFGLLFLFSASVVTTQARMAYFVMAAIWVVFLVQLARQDKRLAGAIVLAGVVLLAAAVGVAGKRLGYAFQSISTEDDASYQYRVENSWSQIDPILREVPLTGVGPDTTMMFGSDVPELDRWGGHALMESGYRLFLAMYGIPGLALVIGLLLLSMGSVYRVLRSPDGGWERRALAAAALASLVYIAFNLYSSNVVDELMPLPFAWLLGGLLMRDHADESAARSRAVGACVGLAA